MGGSGSAVEEHVNPILNSAMLCVLWGRGRHAPNAIFPKAPERLKESPLENERQRLRKQDIERQT